MKWLRFRHAGTTGFGVLEGTQVQVHAGELFGEHRPTGQQLPVAEIAWLAPCAPRSIVGLWNNFDALAAKNGWSRPAEPLYFLKAPGSLNANEAPIPAPGEAAGRIGYEGELAVVIGRTTRAVAPDAAADHIFGYTCANDVTAIELLHRDPSFAQWTRAKGFDGFCPIGPVIETAFDFESAGVRTRVGGRERQNYPLSDMTVRPAELVSRISHDMTLEAGDVILCGTSLGVLPMKAGSTVEVEIDGIGVLRNVFG